MNKFSVSLLVLTSLLVGCQKKTAEGQTTASTPTTAASVSESQASTPASADLLRVNGRGFTQADIDFAGLMLELQILSQDATLEEKAAAIKRTQNVNVRLNHLIERYAMGLLGDEKHYSIPEAQIAEERQKLQKQIDAHPNMQQAIEKYGQDRFTGRVHEYLRQQVIRERIVQDLLATQKSKSPKADAKELDYNTAQAYDELFQAHMDDLEVELNLNGLPPKSTSQQGGEKPAPRLAVTDGAGQPYRLPTPTGKRPLLINFWATWCGPCREELPLLLQAQASGKYQVVIVNVDESAQKVTTFLKAQQLQSLPVAYAKTNGLKGWNIPGLPTSYLIGPGWTQLDQHFGPLKAGQGWLSGL